MFVVPTVFVNIVLSLVRLVLTITFFKEARLKFRDLKGFSKADSVPLPVAAFVATAELCAALGMLTGVLSQWAGLGLVILMIFTTGMHIFKWHSPYWANKRGWEYDVLMLVLAAVVVVFGAGAFVLFA